jgi:hypothetical protein
VLPEKGERVQWEPLVTYSMSLSTTVLSPELQRHF